MPNAMHLKKARKNTKGETLIEVLPNNVKDNPNESDEQIIERMRERFQILDDMTQASIDGVVRGMVVTGPPGVGKSFGVEQVLEKNSLFDVLANNKLRFEVIKGASSAIGLYKVLYNNADKNSVLVLDDCDTVLYDETSLNLLKAALDSCKKRKLCWNTDSALLRREGIPDSFEFNGSVIFITNLKFDNVRGKIKDHLAAIMSRCHYLDLTMDTTREKVLRCKQIVADGMLNEYDFTDEEETDLMDFMISNKEKMREISLRMVTKLADLKKSFGDEKWKRTAEVTCMRRAA
jgi:hypothetical protein|tara:strand:+ start:7919 stop:8791 length:873 start_codon:yes stop_codon:yes gene_type:complete